jgi:DNA (cytosine-5)-methyltransferase 1
MDLFCGTGGFSKGFENSSCGQFVTIFGNDILPYAIETFKKNHSNAKAFAGDIRKLRRADIQELLKIKKGDIDVIVGGPPCQGFSSIRPFRSSFEDDPRNSLFEEYASFVNYFRPKMFVIENVVGLATHKDGETIQQMHECFDKLGYDCNWKILNSAHYGVPQKRERLIFIGAEKGGKITFPAPSHYYNGATIGCRDKKRLMLPEDVNLFNSQTLHKVISVMDAIGDLPPIESGEEATNYSQPPVNAFQDERRKRSNTLSLHSSTKHTPKMLEIISYSGKDIRSIPKHLITSGFSSCYSRLGADEPSVTITVNFVHPASNKCIHPIRNRALTPREGARLQSFDDDFYFAGNRTQIVKQIGNAVPPLLGKAIAEEIRRAF